MMGDFNKMNQLKSKKGGRVALSENVELYQGAKIPEMMLGRC